MNYMLHGKRFITHLSCCALLLLFAASPPQAAAAVPGGVTLNTPANGDTLNPPGNAVFSWSTASPAADWYFLWVNKDNSTFLTKWVQTNAFTVANGLPGGTYTWWVRGWNSSGLGPWSSSSSFTVTAGTPGTVTPIAPVGTVETNSTLNYTWTQDTSSTWYQLFIHKNGAFFKTQWFGPSDVSINANNVTVVVSGHTSGTYTWWVRPWGPDGIGQWSSNATFTVQASGEPGAVTLTTPANGATTSTFVTLGWTEPDPAADWFYVFMNKDNDRFLTRWVQTNSLSFDNGLRSGTYTWWVRPWNSAGFGQWSSSSTFTVVGGTPTNITLVAPIGGAAISGSAVTYEWQDDPSATWFQLFVNQNNRLFLNQWYSASALSFINGSHRAVTITNEPTGNYTWWVRGWSPDGIGPWSDMGAYTVTGP